MSYFPFIVTNSNRCAKEVLLKKKKKEQVIFSIDKIDFFMNKKSATLGKTRFFQL